MVNEVLVISIAYKTFSSAPKMVAIDSEVIEEPKVSLVSFITVACMMAGSTDKEGAEVRMSAELITAQTLDADCTTALASVK